MEVVIAILAGWTALAAVVGIIIGSFIRAGKGENHDDQV